MSFRKEEKIIISDTEISNLKSMITEKGFKIIYPPRKIDSIYFENLDLQCFYESEEGIVPRKKFRIRNYPELKIKKYNLEIKTSSVEGRFKLSKEIDFKTKELYLKNGIFDNLYGHLNRKVKVSYSREYFGLNDMRITIDTHIKYLSLKSNRVYNDSKCVVEIKVDQYFDEYILNKIISSSKNRFSKYCNAILCLERL